MAGWRLILVSLLVAFCAFLNVNGQKKVIDLNEDNWGEMLTGEWMVEFYAPWCPACKGLKPTWDEFATWSKELGIKVGKVDVTTSPGLSGRFMVTALPTIFHIINGEFRQYKGSRDKESFISFVDDRKWEQVDPVPGWKAPDSIQMSVVSSFFKLSQILRRIHTQLMEEFGMPTWGSYLIFALATIMLGALLGLILVCIIDFIYPPRPIATDEKKDGKEKDSSEDELADEDIKDDLLDDASQSEGEKVSGSDTEEKKDTPPRSNPNSPRMKQRKPRRAD